MWLNLAVNRVRETLAMGRASAGWEMGKKPLAGSVVGDSTKKCPECYEYVPLTAAVCPQCKTRLGKAGRHGMADRPINWKAYIICFILWVILAFYIKWAFF